jgi:hypothetical protein
MPAPAKYSRETTEVSEESLDKISGLHQETRDLPTSATRPK